MSSTSRTTTSLDEPTACAAQELARLLPELAVTLYQSAPHHARRPEPADDALTGRQMEAVVFLAHRGSATMSEFADGLDISRGAASELVSRMLEKGVIRRGNDASDRRVVRVALAGDAEDLAESMFDRWREQLAHVFARYPEIDPGVLVAFLGDLIDLLKGRTSA